jgi:hypothetical protein
MLLGQRLRLSTWLALIILIVLYHPIFGEMENTEQVI